MVECKACHQPILSLNLSKDGMHRKCWRIYKGRYNRKPKKKKAPMGYVHTLGRISFRWHLPADLFDALCLEYVQSAFPGTFSAYITDLVNKGRLT